MPSLAMMRETWVFTVPTSTNSASAISALLSPSATAASTSCSRAVSCGGGAAARSVPPASEGGVPPGAGAASGEAGLRRTNSRITRPVTAGETRASPRAAAWTAVTSCCGSVSLRRNPTAPFSSAPNTYSSRSKVVMTTTGSGESTPGPASSAVAVSPSPPGMRTSMRTTSGREARASLTASSPSAASATTSMSPAVARNIRRERRTVGWSSAMSTRIMSPPGR